MPDPTIYRTEYLLHVGMYVGYVLGIHLFTIFIKHHHHHHHQHRRSYRRGKWLGQSLNSYVSS